MPDNEATDPTAVAPDADSTPPPTPTDPAPPPTDESAAEGSVIPDAAAEVAPETKPQE